MKLYKALKLKNELVSEIKNLNSKVLINNVKLKDNVFNYVMQDILNDLDKKTKTLIELKVAIQKANEPIYSLIFELSELKSKMNTIKSLSTNKGIERTSRYSSEGGVVEYECQIDQVEKDGMIDQIGKNISKLQDRIDEFNYSTEITF